MKETVQGVDKNREIINGISFVVCRNRQPYLIGSQEISLPDIIFPDKYLGQKPMTLEDIINAANWFVYDIDPETGKIRLDDKGKPEFNSLFKILLEITEPNSSPIFEILKFLTESEFAKYLLKNGIRFPYYESQAMREIAKLVFARRIKDEYKTPGSQLFYSIIGPVYDFFHQMNTQAVPEFHTLTSINNNLPFALIDRSEFTSEKNLYYPNDARGRDEISKDLTEESLRLKQENKDQKIRILAIGDGPAMTTLKTMLKMVKEGITNVEFTILEYNKEQIENGKRAYAKLTDNERKLLEQNNISVKWVQGDASNICFENNYFNMVFSTYVVGAFGGNNREEIVKKYGLEALRVLQSGGKHFVLDFYHQGKYRDSDEKNDNDLKKLWLESLAKNLFFLIKKPLENCYLGIWDHHTELYDILIDISKKEAAEHILKSRQTVFGYFPLKIVNNNKVLTFVLPGYVEMKSIFIKS